MLTYELPHAALGTRARYLIVGSKAALDIAAYGQVKRSRDDGGWDVVYQSDDFHGPDAGWGYEKFTRRAIDWATVAVAAVRRGDGSRVRP